MFFTYIMILQYNDTNSFIKLNNPINSLHLKFLTNSDFFLFKNHKTSFPKINQILVSAYDYL
jgi:hypothetical protein